MLHPLEIKKFFYSQYALAGLRMTIGIALPPLIALLIFDSKEIGFILASGAIGISVVDLPGPLKYKHHEMLSCCGFAFIAALASSLAAISGNHMTMWLTIVPLTFLLSMIVVYPEHGPQISFGALYMMIINIERHFTLTQAISNTFWLTAGCLWYTYFSYFLSRIHAERNMQQLIAEAIFATANYIRIRSRFFDLNETLDDVYHDLVVQQINAVEKQNAARDIVLRTLPTERSRKDWQRIKLFNLFINCVDMHDRILASHTDYALLRQSFKQHDLLIFFRDLIKKIAQELDGIGLSVLQNYSASPSHATKAELRAIEFEIERLRRKNWHTQNVNAYAAISATFRRVWNVTRLVERMRRNTYSTSSSVMTEMKIDQALSKFLVKRHFSFKQIWTNCIPSSPNFRHAIRVTLAVAIGYLLGRIMPFTNSYWVILTAVIIIKPAFSLTRQRNIDRIVGTALGCGATVLLIVLVKDFYILLGVMFAAMFMAYALSNLHYGAASLFTSAFVLIFYHLLAPAGMKLIEERAIDTIIGGVLAIALSYIYANWEYRLLQPLIAQLLKSINAYMGEAMPASVFTQPAVKHRAVANDQDKYLINHALNDQALQPSINLNAYQENDEIKQKNRLLIDDDQQETTPIYAYKNEHESVDKQLVIQTNTAKNSLNSSTKDTSLKDSSLKDASLRDASSKASFNSDMTYRLARNNVNVNFVNLGQAFSRMLREPRSRQRNVAEINELLIQSHVIISQMASIAGLLDSVNHLKLDALAPVKQILIEDLKLADEGKPFPSDYLEHRRQIIRNLDEFVVQTENAYLKPGSNQTEQIDALQIDALKALVYQSKQMLKAVSIIRQQAAKIQL